MSVDLGALREAGKTVGSIDQRILSIANRVFSWRIEGLRLGGTRVVNVPVVVGSKGSVLSVGTHIFFRLSLGGDATVLAWSLAATVNGLASARSVTLDVAVGATLASTASICGSGRPALALQQEVDDQPPANWTTVTITDPSWVLVSVIAVDTTVEVVGLTLQMAVS